VRRARPTVACQERLEQLGARVLSDAELLTLLLSPTAGSNSVRDAAAKLLEAPALQIAWASPDEFQQQAGIGPARAAAIAAAFELGRRADADMKRRTLAALPSLGGRRRRVTKQTDELIAFLESLQETATP